MPEPQTQPTPSVQEPPKKACMISLMFAIDNDDMALAVKRKIDEVIPDLEKKRYTFQITET